MDPAQNEFPAALKQRTLRSIDFDDPEAKKHSRWPLSQRSHSDYHSHSCAEFDDWSLQLTGHHCSFRLDQDAPKEKIMFLQLNPINSDNLLPCVWIVAETLQYIWARRRSKQKINVPEMKDYISGKFELLACTKMFGSHALNIHHLLNN